MQRFFVEPFQVLEEEHRITLTGPDLNHMKNVLRMRIGEDVWISDGSEKEYHCTIEEFQEDSAVLHILYAQESQYELPSQIYLFQGLPKGDKMEWILQKAVELGASEIVPVLTERCISRPDEKSMDKKLARWQKIAVEASKQCGRGRIPAVCPLMRFSEAARALGKMEKGLFFYEKGGLPLKESLRAPAKQIGIFVGAEGGFSPEEARLVQESGAVCVSLGNRILRCETAPLAALSAILYETDNF